MFKTNIGAFDGNSWEALCQQVFKKKYAQDGYQHIPPSPGDFGLEGFCAATGQGFQCYCPNTHYTRKELYGHQRDKITRDLKSLKDYQSELVAILGNTKISVWRFVTPEIGHNDLLAHARTKEREVQSWGLSFISSDFSIQLHDADYYLKEINEIRMAAGEFLDFQNCPATIAELLSPPEVYEENVLRKCKTRLAPKASSDKYAFLLDQLQKQTLASFLESDGYFRTIERTAPVLYFKLARLINEFELFMQEKVITWTDSPEDLTNFVRQDLERRLIGLGPEINQATSSQIARHMVARWLAICSLDYD